MTKTRTLTKKALSAVIALLMILSAFALIPEKFQLNANATTPSYANWHSNDTRWSGIKYSNIGVNASNYNASMNVAFAQAVAHLGVGSTTESTFNPLTFYNNLKSQYDSQTSVAQTVWSVAYSADPSGLLTKYSDKISVVSKDTTSYSSSNFSTLASKLKTNYSNGYVSVLYVGSTWVTVYNASASTAWIMDPSGTYSNLKYYMDAGSKVTCVYVFKATTSRRATGWYDYKDTYSGKYYIKNVSTGKYLTVDGNKDANATNVSVAALTGATGQVWTISNGTDGYKLTPTCSSTRTLNVYADTVKTGTNVNIYAGSGESQEWLINIFDGFVFLNNAQNTNCVLNANGTNVNVTTYSNATTQQWILEPATSTTLVNGTYYLKNKSTGTYLYAGGTTSTSKVALGAKKTTTAYQMKITPVTSGNALKGSYITPASGSVVLNPYADTLKNGTTVNLYTKNTDGTQFWVFEPVSGGYIIHNYSNSNLVLNGSGTSVTVATNTKANSQIWILESVSSTTTTTTTKAATTTTTTTTATTTVATTTSIPTDIFSGDGTEDSPYLIESKADLENLRSVINDPDRVTYYGDKYYLQTADIDLEDEEWTPIGRFYDSDDSDTLGICIFNGTYDGNYHNITGLNVNGSRNYNGLFGRVNANAKIYRLSVSGTVTADGQSCAGGIIGEMGYGAYVENCSFNGSVSGNKYVGGIAGKSQGGGSIIGCYANADISAAEDSAGGLVGYILTGMNSSAADFLMQNSYFTGTVSAPSQSGGITGGVEIGTVKENTVKFENNYYLDTAEGDFTVTGTSALKSAMLKASDEALGTPFVKSATINDGYPVFEWQLIIKGDVNKDGNINSADLVALQKFILGNDSPNCKAGDVNSDGVIDVFDNVALRTILIAQ